MMTGPDESIAAPRPISVAELLAKNGTIGSPPVSSRRRRRRGNAEAVTVAELTGEIPIIAADTFEKVDDEPVEEFVTELSEEVVPEAAVDGEAEESADDT